MKRNDAGEFCILYLEPSDDRDTLLRVIIGQHKHIVLMLAEQSKLFQRPEEFVALKHIKRQLDVSIFFVIARGERVTQLAERNGFPVYRSMDALNEALTKGRPARQRVSMRVSGEPASAVSTASVASPISIASHTPRKTVPLKPMEHDVADAPTRPVVAMHPSSPSPGWPSAHPAMPSPSLSSMPSMQSPSSPRPVATLPRPEPMMSTIPPPAASPARPVALPVTPLPPPPSIQAAPQTASPTPSQPQQKRGGTRLPRVLIALMILALSAAGLGSLLVFYHAPSVDGQTGPMVIGHVYFLSSGQVNENTNQGIDDEVQVDLSNLANPAAGKKYYAWLLSDKNQGETHVISLGALQVNKGEAHLFYGGDPAHTNLLAITSRFLVTEEGASVPPMAPSPDYTTWRYYGEFLQTPSKISSSMPGMDGMAHYSFLDHLRHLLAADPMLDQNELPGGLNNWFYHNTEKVLEWTGSMREIWEESKDIGSVRRQTVRTLTYLDGLSYVSRDIPPNTPLDLNDRLARIGLIEVNGPNQDPPSYLDSIVFHLNGLIQAGGSTPTLRKEAAALLAAMDNVRYWLAQVRRDGQQIMRMTEAQLLQPSTLSLINDMIVNASNAYAGQIDPTTNQMREGVTWIHDHMQVLAMLDITPYKASSSPVQMISSKLAWYMREGKA